VSLEQWGSVISILIGAGALYYAKSATGISEEQLESARDTSRGKGPLLTRPDQPRAVPDGPGRLLDPPDVKGFEMEVSSGLIVTETRRIASGF